MAITSKKLYWGTPGTGSPAVLYTVPTSTTTYVKEIALCNTTSSPAWVTLHFVNSGGAASTGNQFLGTFYVPASSSTDPARNTVIIACYEHLDTGDTIQGVQQTAGAVNMRICGVEVS